MTPNLALGDPKLVKWNPISTLINLVKYCFCRPFEKYHQSNFEAPSKYQIYIINVECQGLVFKEK